MSKTKITIRPEKVSINTYYNRLEAEIADVAVGARIMKMRRDAPDGLLITIQPYKKETDKQMRLMWKFCGEIAAELSKSAVVKADQVYRKAIEQVGVFQDLDVPNGELAQRARMWARSHKGNFSEELYPKPEGGKTKVRQYFGASTYNSKQMQRLLFCLEDIANDLKLDIDVSTNAAINALLGDQQPSREDCERASTANEDRQTHQNAQ